MILENVATQKTALIQRWLPKRHRVYLHVTPASAPWITFVECWFPLL